MSIKSPGLSPLAALRANNLSDIDTPATARVNLGIPGAAQLSVFAAGTAAIALGTVAAMPDFSTTDPTITINGTGAWLIQSRGKYDFNGATFAAVRTLTQKLRRTNNTAADVGNSTVTWKVPIVTTAAHSAGELNNTTIYTTTNTTDILQLQCAVDVAPSAGSLDIAEASIIATRLQA